MTGPEPQERCEPLTDVDGNVVAVARVSADLGERGRAADPPLPGRQEAGRWRIRERNARLRGEVE